MVDISIYESKDGGELYILNDDLSATNCISNQVYLALWGGNIQENTTEQTNKQAIRNDWWGNDLMAPSNQFNSNTERILRDIVITSAGISIVENAIKKDLSFLDEYYDIEINVVMVNHNRIEIDIDLAEPDSKSTKIKYICVDKKMEAFPGITETCSGIGDCIIETNFIIR